MNPNFLTIIHASIEDRRQLFLTTAQRLGTTLENVEKDFWVCWVLDLIFNGRAEGEPRILFKGGTSLSKAYGIISRFSEDIDITIFREDLGYNLNAEDLGMLSRKQQNKKLEAIRNVCQNYIQEQLKIRVDRKIKEIFQRTESSTTCFVENDVSDSDNQTLLIHYPSVIDSQQLYIQPSVKIEGGAKSALIPNQQVSIKPYISEDVPFSDFLVKDILTIDAERTFWDKVIILHGIRSWFEHKGEIRHQGNRISRHYYDIFKLTGSDLLKKQKYNYILAVDCARHAEIFFNSSALGLSKARPGTFRIAPTSQMVTTLQRDYNAMATMIFGDIPSFEMVLDVIYELEEQINTKLSE